MVNVTWRDMGPFNTGATLEVYCHGTGDFLAKVFEGVSLLMGGDDYTSLIRIAGFVGTIVFSMQMLFMREYSVKWIAGYVALYLFFFCPQVNIGIVDYLNPANDRVVAGVPAGLGYFAHLTSSIGDKLTEMSETAFVLPDDVAYRGNGLAGAVGFLKRTTEFSLPPNNLKDDVDKFVQNCTFYDLFDGAISNEELLKSQDLVNLIFGTEQVRFTTYHNPPDGKNTLVDTCVSVAPILRARLLAAYPQISGQLRQLIFADLPIDFEGKVTNTYDYFMNAARGAQDVIMQNMLANQVVESTKNFAVATGGDAKLLSLALAQAAQEQKAQWYIIGDLAQKTLPVFRAILEGVFYGAFPFIFILMLTPLMGKVLQGYIVVLVSLQLWFPLEAIVNLFTNIKMKQMLVAAAGTGAYGAGAVDTLAGFPYMYQITQEMLSAAWAFEIIVPVLAYSLVKGGEFALTHAIGNLTSTTQSAGARAGQMAATGNINMGNVGMGGVKWDNVMAHGHDASYRTNMGAATNVSAGGSWGPFGTSFQRATVAGFSQTMGSIVSSGFTERATESVEAGKSHLAQASKSAEATMQRTKSFVDALEHSQGHTKSHQAAEELSYIKDAQEAKSALVQKGVELGFSREGMTQYANSIGVDGGIGCGSSFFARLGGKASRDHREMGRVADSAKDLDQWAKQSRIEERIGRGQKVVDSYSTDAKSSQMSKSAKEIRAGQSETVGHLDQASAHFKEADSYTKAAEQAERMDYGTAANIEHMFLKDADPKMKAAYARGDDPALMVTGMTWAKENAPELLKKIENASGFSIPAIEKLSEPIGLVSIPSVADSARKNAGQIPASPSGYNRTRDDVHREQKDIGKSVQATESRILSESVSLADKTEKRIGKISSEIKYEAGGPGAGSVLRGTNHKISEETKKRRKE